MPVSLIKKIIDNIIYLSILKLYKREIKMKLLTKAIKEKLIKNHESGEDENRKPVVKFFGGSSCTWLISEGEPLENGDMILFGLCDLGHGCAELGNVMLSELQSIRFKPFGLGVERDRHWTSSESLMGYARRAWKQGYIS